MNALVEMGPVLGLVALCAALGLSRATYYRRRKEALGASAGQPATTGPGVPEPPGDTSEGLPPVGPAAPLEGPDVPVVASGRTEPTKTRPRRCLPSWGRLEPRLSRPPRKR